MGTPQSLTARLRGLEGSLSAIATLAEAEGQQQLHDRLVGLRDAVMLLERDYHRSLYDDGLRQQGQANFPGL